MPLIGVTLPQLEEASDVISDEPPPAIDDRAIGVLHKYGDIRPLIPAVLCVVMFGQLLFCSRHLSQTGDEATHLYSGYRYLKCGDLTVSPEHPPFAKVVAAIPVLLMNVAVDCAPFRGDGVQQAFAALKWFYSHEWPVMLVSSRMAMSVFGVGLCLLVWVTAHKMFGLTTAIVAGVLLIFEPNVLAYSSLILTDVPVTCTLLLAVMAFYCWGRHRSVKLLLLTALATGLTLLTKHSGVIVVPILVILAVTEAVTESSDEQPTWKRALSNLRAVALICSLAVGIVWLGYGMRFGHSKASESGTSGPSAASTGRLWLQLERFHLLPAAYIEGFVTAEGLPGQTTVVVVGGKIYPHAPWFATPFNFLIRTTTGMLIMMLAAAFGVAITFHERRRERMFLLVPVSVYLVACIEASGNVSVRYLLPVFPFLLIATASGCVELARHVRWARYALPCLLVLHAASSLHAYPNYLSYSSDLWGGPDAAYKYQSWLDMGQAYREAKTYLKRHRTDNCWLITGWQWDPAFYDVPCYTFGLYLPHEIPPHVHGTIIISSTLLTDVRLPEGELAAAFRGLTPKGQIGGGALLIYEGDFDTSLDAAVGERNLAAYESSVGRLASALEHGKRAVQLAPTSALAHANLCFLLAPNEVDLALKECYKARNLLLHDPLRQEQTRRQYLDSLEISLSVLRSKYRIVYGREPNVGVSLEAKSGDGGTLSR